MGSLPVEKTKKSRTRRQDLRCPPRLLRPHANRTAQERKRASGCTTTRWLRRACMARTRWFPCVRRGLLARAGITRALVGPGSTLRARAFHSGGNLVILLLSLSLCGARTRYCPFRLGRLLLDSRFVVFRATSQRQQADT